MFVVIKKCLSADLVIVQGKKCIEAWRKFRKERSFFSHSFFALAVSLYEELRCRLLEVVLVTCFTAKSIVQGQFLKQFAFTTDSDDIFSAILVIGMLLQQHVSALLPQSPLCRRWWESQRLNNLLVERIMHNHLLNDVEIFYGTDPFHSDRRTDVPKLSAQSVCVHVFRYNSLLRVDVRDVHFQFISYTHVILMHVLSQRGQNWWSWYQFRSQKKKRCTDSQQKSDRKHKDLGGTKRKGIAPMLQKSLKANS